MDPAVQEKKSLSPLPKKTRLILILCAVLALAALIGALAAGRYIGSTARLLQMKGTVFLSSAEGRETAPAENMRFRSGNALRTESSSLASVGLDESKIITMNENSRAEFLKRGKKIQLHLTEGRLFFQVSRKLAHNESFDIRTSTMVVGIRGTSGYVSVDEDGHERVYVTDGTVHITGTNPATGEVREIDISAGERVTVYLFNDKDRDSIVFFVEEVGGEDTLPCLIPVSLSEDEVLREKVCAVTGWDAEELCELADGYKEKGADMGVNVPVNTAGHAVEERAVFISSDSAARVYDGTPLSAPGYRVEGLDAGYRVEALLPVTITDAGSTANAFSELVIRNAEDEDVTRYFLNLNIREGTLTIKPLPVLLLTGSAEKVYDATPLTEGSYSVFAYTHPFISARVKERVSGAARAFVCADEDGNETLWVLTGSVQLLGVNPLTQETVCTRVDAGRLVRLQLFGDREKDSLVFLSEPVDSAGLPEEVLRHIASDRTLLGQILEEAVFDGELLTERIAALSRESESADAPDDPYIQRLGVCQGACYQICVDSDAAQFRGRFLSDGEARLIVPELPALPSVLVTGSRTDAGSSDNTCEADWGELDPNNYEPRVEYGTLTVRPAPVTVTTSSRTRRYNGEPLTDERITVKGLLEPGVELWTTGSQTDAGSSDNTYEIDWNGVDPSNYQLIDELGTLTVTKVPVTITTGGSSKRYDGTPLLNQSVRIIGAPSDVEVMATGSQTDAGTSKNTYEIDWGENDPNNYEVTEILGDLTVTKIPVTVTTGSASKPYDGTPLTNGAISLSGAPDGVTARATGSRTDAGTSRNGYRINWNGHDPKNYEVTENLGTLTVTNISFSVFTASSSKTYDGTPLTNSGIKLSGAPAGVTAAATGSQTNAGTSANSYSINWNGQNPNNYTIVESLGTLTVTPKTVYVITGTSELPYSPWQTTLTNSEAAIYGVLEPGVTVSATGRQVGIGQSVNTCVINWNGVNAANYSVDYSGLGFLMLY